MTTIAPKTITPPAKAEDPLFKAALASEADTLIIQGLADRPDLGELRAAAARAGKKLLADTDADADAICRVATHASVLAAVDLLAQRGCEVRPVPASYAPSASERKRVSVWSSLDFSRGAVELFVGVPAGCDPCEVAFALAKVAPMFAR